MSEKVLYITWPEKRPVIESDMRGWAKDAMDNGEIENREDWQTCPVEELAQALDRAGKITWFGKVEDFLGADEEDEGDPDEGWLGDSYFGAYDDDPSPYDGTYSEM